MSLSPYRPSPRPCRTRRGAKSSRSARRDRRVRLHTSATRMSWPALRRMRSRLHRQLAAVARLQPLRAALLPRVLGEPRLRRRCLDGVDHGVRATAHDSRRECPKHAANVRRFSSSKSAWLRSVARSCRGEISACRLGRPRAGKGPRWAAQAGPYPGNESADPMSYLRGEALFL